MIYTRQQIEEAIQHWERQLQRLNEEQQIDESIDPVLSMKNTISNKTRDKKTKLLALDVVIALVKFQDYLKGLAAMSKGTLGKEDVTADVILEDGVAGPDGQLVDVFLASVLAADALATKDAEALDIVGSYTPKDQAEFFSTRK